ncbi:MAG: DUF3040 domain-containing protein [Galbitalea sp.]
MPISSRAHRAAGASRPIRPWSPGFWSAILGVATLVAGVVIRQPVVGVIGFVLMFVGVLVALTPARGGRSRQGDARHGGAPQADAAPGPKRTGGSFLQNLNERWRTAQRIAKNSDREEIGLLAARHSRWTRRRNQG